MKLTAEMVEAFAGLYLSPRYDEAQPTPEMHRECWGRYCSESPACATAAPRNHAKSTALTHDFGLAAAVFRVEPYIVLIGSTEELAIEHLGDITNELRENEALIRDFGIARFVTEAKTDIIVECTDGYQFRFVARGSEQKIRGRKWRGRRPGLLIFDDIEDDEQVENRERRQKFRKWFFRACKQALRDGGKIRGHGTILHVDSQLARLMRNRSWNSRLYKAHRSFSDFADILWPEKFPEARLRGIRQEFIDDGDSAGYSQEYLNDPQDDANAYLRREYFLPMHPDDFTRYKRLAVGVDFAISKKDSANRNSFTVVGKDEDNIVHNLDQRTFRGDTPEIIEAFFDIEDRWHPEVFFVEDGQIWKAIKPTLYEDMRERDLWPNIEVLSSISDKASRGRPFQKRMKGGGCRFDTEAPWFEEAREEMLHFTGIAEAVLDDIFDSHSIVHRGIAEWGVMEPEDQLTDEEIQFARESAKLREGDGRSRVTGY